MKIPKSLFCGVAASMLASCSVHPLPEQAEGGKTTEIVTKIRCEARRAIEDIAIARLYELGRKAFLPDADLAGRLERERDAGGMFELEHFAVIRTHSRSFG